MDPKAFANPPGDTRPAPFWFWNGNIEEAELVRQIREMADKGVGGFVIAAGAGLRIPYLSQTWFDRVTLAVETAKQNDLYVWFHDAFPHARGLTGGRVVLTEPRHRAQYLTFRETTVQGGQQVDLELPWATVLRAVAVPLRRDRSLWEDAEEIDSFIGVDHRAQRLRKTSDSHPFFDRQFETHDPIQRLYWKAPAGRWRVLVFLQQEVRGPDQTGSHFDPLSREAVLTYIRSTFQPYVDLAGKHAGKTIKGFYTTCEAEPPGQLPWSSILPDAYRARNGYDLVSQLPALITPFGPNTARIRYDYFQTLSELLQLSYHRTCAEWAADNKLTFATDVPLFRSAHLDAGHIAGIKGGTEKGHAESPDGACADPSLNPVFAASAARQTGSGRVFATVGQGAGWSLSSKDIKSAVDRLAAEGCNIFNPHGFSYTLDGLRKHDGSASQFNQSPHWESYGAVSDYIGRLTYALTSGTRVSRVALLEPGTSLIAHLGHPGQAWRYSGFDSDEEKLAERLRADWAAILEALPRLGRNFDCLDPAMLAQGKVRGREIHVGDCVYDVLVIPPITNLERDAFELMRDFINNEGTVISVSLLPIEDIQEGPSIVEAISKLSDMEAGRMIKDYMGHELGVHLVNRGNLHLVRTGGCVVENNGTRALGEVLDQVAPKDIIVQTEKRAIGSVLIQERTDDSQRILFLANTAGFGFDAKVAIATDQEHTIERWDLETGDRQPLPTDYEDGRLTTQLRFEAHSSHLLVSGKSDAKADAKVVEETETADLGLSIEGGWRLDPEADNALRLDRFRMQIDPQDRGARNGWASLTHNDGRWASVEPALFSEQLGAISQTNVPLTYANEEGQPEVGLPLVVWYRATFQADLVPSKLSLVLDRSAILGDFQVYVNGSRLPNNAFRPTFRYDNSNLTCALGRRVTKGKNVIAVRLEVSKLSDGLVDAFYLFGKFGVRKWRSDAYRIGVIPERGPFGDLDQNRMPFYAGTVAYTQEVSLKRPKLDRFSVTFDRDLRDTDDVYELSVNGHVIGVRPWSPYTWEGKSSLLKNGRNRITLRVSNTLSRLLTGKRFNTRTHRMSAIRA